MQMKLNKIHESWLS